MQALPAVDPIPVGGVRLGAPLAQLTLCRAVEVQRSLVGALSRLADEGVNIVCMGFTLGTCPGRPGGTSICVSQRDAAAATGAFESSGRLAPRLHVVRPVALLTVFPHRRRVDLLVRLLSWMRQASLPVLAVSSSLAAVGLVVPMRGLERALDRLEAHLALPANHAPLISPLRVVQVERGAGCVRQIPANAPGRETIAVYSELPIRHYGFSVQRGRTLLCLPAETDPQAVEAHLEKMPASQCSVPFCAAVGAPDGALLLNLAGDFPLLGAHLSAGAVCQRDVETVTFHGPHFGDRYGIAAAALDCLERGAVPLLAASFAGASVTLVVPAGGAERAMAALESAFAGPASDREPPGSADRAGAP